MKYASVTIRWANGNRPTTVRKVADVFLMKVDGGMSGAACRVTCEDGRDYLFQGWVEVVMRPVKK